MCLRLDKYLKGGGVDNLQMFIFACIVCTFVCLGDYKGVCLRQSLWIADRRTLI